MAFTERQPPIPFLQWGSLTASPMHLDRYDFMLYDRIEQEENRYFIYGKLIWRDEDNRASLERFRDGTHYPPGRQFLASRTEVNIIDKMLYKTDHRDGLSCASLCKPLNDSEFLYLVTSLQEAQEKGASASVLYYHSAMVIYAEWYHDQQLDLPVSYPIALEKVRDEPQVVVAPTQTQFETKRVAIIIHEISQLCSDLRSMQDLANQLRIFKNRNALKAVKNYVGYRPGKGLGDYFKFLECLNEKIEEAESDLDLAISGMVKKVRAEVKMALKTEESRGREKNQ